MNPRSLERVTIWFVLGEGASSDLKAEERQGMQFLEGLSREIEEGRRVTDPIILIYMVMADGPGTKSDPARIIR